MSARIICFVNNKGGCGKTTTVAAIGQAWALQGKKILFVDLDSQANLTSMITDTDPTSYEWETTIMNALTGGSEFLYIEHVSDNIDIIPADLDLSNFETESLKSTTREFLLADILDGVRDNYDYILVDCPPALGMITYNALVASDYLVLVTTTDGPSYRGMKMVVEMYNQVQQNRRLNPDIDILGVIVTKYESNNISRKYKKTLQDELGELIIEPIVRKATRISAAMSFQVSLYEYDPKGNATQDYMQVAAELHRRLLEAESVKSHKQSK